MKALIGRRYRHYKGGEYEVIMLARNEMSPKEIFVIYRALYESEDFGKGCVWAREQGCFEGDVEVNGVLTPRFSMIEHV